MIHVSADGNVAKDAEVVSYGPAENRKTLVSFGLICDKFYGDENPTYIQCTIFGAGDNVAKHVKTGRQMIVYGDLNRNDGGYYNLNVKQFSYGRVPMGKGYNVDDMGSSSHDAMESNYGGYDDDPRHFGR